MAWNVIFSTRSVDERLAKAEDRMDLLHKENKILTERIAALEQRGPSTADTTVLDRKMNTVVLGGWPRDTKKEDIVEGARKIVERLGLQGRLEQPFWSPGSGAPLHLATSPCSGGKAQKACVPA